MDEFTSVRVRCVTKERLKRVGKMGQSMDCLLNELVDLKLNGGSVDGVI